MRRVLAFAVCVLAVVGCGGGGGGSGGSTLGSNCSEVLPEERLCDLSCTLGDRSTMDEVMHVLLPNGGMTLTPTDLEYGGVTYQVIGFRCENDGTPDLYDYEFWLEDDGLVHFAATGEGKYAFGASEDRVTIPACVSVCNGLPIAAAGLQAGE